MNVAKPKRAIKVLIALCVLFGAASAAEAQTLTLSRNADFSTTDVVYAFTDTLYARVTAPGVNSLDIKDNEFRLKPRTGDDNNDIEGAFNNNLNGTYDAKLILASLRQTTSAWEFRVKIRDDDDGRFETRVNLTIQGQPGTGDTLAITATIDSLGAGFIILGGDSILVDNQTVVSEFGLPLSFSDLEFGWKVMLVAERRADGNLWALTILVLERDTEDQEVETEGVIAALDSMMLTVNNIRFYVNDSTEILDENGTPVPFSTLAIGMLVEAKGRRTASGDVLAERVKIKDDEIGGDEIEITGEITALVVDGEFPEFVAVNNTLFEINSASELIGFNNEVIAAADLQMGEFVQVKARTRAGNIPVIEKLQREDRDDDDLEIKGTILALGDSSLTVGVLTFAVTSSTIILDNDRNFISFSDLRAGLLVEVKAVVAADSSLEATQIKVEDENENEIEIKGFVDAVSDSGIVVSGLFFSVDSSTVIEREDETAASLDAILVGMLVEVEALLRFDGTLHALRIKIEDFVQDEIEVRGIVRDIGGDSLTVAGITFHVNAETVLLNDQGMPIGFGDLIVGTVVEIKALFDGARWIALKIQVEDRIDGVVSLRGRIDSLRTDSLRVVDHWVRVTNATHILDDDKTGLAFSELQVGNRVRVLAQLLPDSSLVALRIRRKAAEDDSVNVTGAITALSLNSVTVTDVRFEVDAGTIILSRDDSSLVIQDLRLDMVVQIHAQRQADGSLLALIIREGERRALTGVISSVAAGEVVVQGIKHRITDNSLLLSEQNRPIDVASLAVSQRVQMTSDDFGAQHEVVTMRVIFKGLNTNVDAGSSVTPERFSLFQNYPNPFNPSTIIRFVLQEAGTVKLTVYDLLGRPVRTLVQGALPAGEQQVVWDARSDAGTRVASGVYLYRLEADGISQTRRLTLLR